MYLHINSLLNAYILWAWGPIVTYYYKGPWALIITILKLKFDFSKSNFKSKAISLRARRTHYYWAPTTLKLKFDFSKSNFKYKSLPPLRSLGPQTQENRGLAQR